MNRKENKCYDPPDAGMARQLPLQLVDLSLNGWGGYIILNFNQGKEEEEEEKAITHDDYVNDFSAIRPPMKSTSRKIVIIHPTRTAVDAESRYSIQ